MAGSLERRCLLAQNCSQNIGPFSCSKKHKRWARVAPKVYDRRVPRVIELNRPGDQTDQRELVKIQAGHDRPAASANSRLHLDECRRFSLQESPFRALVMKTAHSMKTAHRIVVEPRTLAVRVLLHLPRVASRKGWMTARQVQRQVSLAAERLRIDAQAATALVAADELPLRDLAFEEIDPSLAIRVLGSLHYLRSTRPGSRYFALVDPADKRPVTLCSISPLQWKCVESYIGRQFAIPSECVLDITRVYSVDSAPPNAISSLLSKVRAYARHNMASTELLVTAVDPNLGFTGHSYRAANWQQWMTVKARPYLYENAHYVSPRQLRERYGTASLAELQTKYPGRFQQSRIRLLDSMIYCCRISGETEAIRAQDLPRLHR